MSRVVVGQGADAGLVGHPHPGERRLAPSVRPVDGGHVPDAGLSPVWASVPPYRAVLRNQFAEVLQVRRLSDEARRLMDVMAFNIDKLEKRYPNGFSHEASRARTA